MDNPVTRISVRNLVEFILQSGDLDNRRGTIDKDAMLKGSRLHRKLQKQMGGDYRAEVALRMNCSYEDLDIRLEGRADGIFTEDEVVWIDEIKGIYGNVEQMEEPVKVHKAQAMCYGYIYGVQEGLSKIGIQMTYANLETEVVKRFREVISIEELKEWYQKLLDEYHKWLSYQKKWKEERNHSLQSLEFPFSYREGQRKMVSSVYHAIGASRQIFIQAPTGVGKTMSTIFPAVRAVGEGKGETIFYLTAKTITRTVAQEAFEVLREKGMKYKVVTITAKEKLCFMDETKCDPVHCPYARGHFDRVNDAVYELWTMKSRYDRETIREQAEKWQVCPFEMCLDLSVWVDAVICDYNYVFDPTVHLKRFFGEGAGGDYIFLIDEAHNLAERGREMYSALLYKEDFLEAKKVIQQKNKDSGRNYRGKKLVGQLDRVNRQMLAWKRECEEGCRVMKSLEGFPVMLMSAEGLLEEYLEEEPPGEERKKLLDLYFQIDQFFKIADRLEESYGIYSMLDENGSFLVKLFCIDTSTAIQECLNKGNSTVFFSATLLPVTYYQSLLSQAKDDYAVYAKTPFLPEQRRVLIGRDVSSRYKRRGPKEYERIADYIKKTVSGCRGNYMVFFPSYRMLEDVGASFETRWGAEFRTLYQKSGMTEEKREEFLKAFEETEGEQSLIGFCVMGGIFGEGIDLKGERLIGAVIVGTGLPQVCAERELLKDYYDSRGMDGFAYAYRIPGMNKVLQSAGRVIRTKEDRGVILLLDERFCEWEYRGMFPREWTDVRSCGLWNVEEELAAFWKS